jgi:hypothetical protein
MLNWRKSANAPESFLIECSAKMTTKYAAGGALASAKESNRSAGRTEHAQPLQALTTTRLGAGHALPGFLTARFLLLLMLAAIVSKAEPAVPVTPGPEIDQAFASMYDTNFPAAHTYLDRYIAAHPADPFGYAVRSSAYLFSELDRLGILESEFFSDDKRIIEKKRLKPDPEVKTKLFQATNEAQSRGAKILASNASDETTLFAMAITQGVLMDYTALVEKKQLSSLSSGRLANSYAQRLIKINPKFYDAYLTTGLSEYLLGSLPFFVKWFVHFDGVNGSKNQGIDNLQLVAKSGHYLRPFAKILLAVVYLREKQPRETQKLLASLRTEYPGNPLLRKELDKVTEQLAKGSADGK